MRGALIAGPRPRTSDFMCGICGIYEYGVGEPGISHEIIARMRETMAHRGPDDAGSFVAEDRRVGLGHRRLSIVDLSPAGRNPMANEDERVWITFNGEIYNHATRRAEMIAKGHRYRSRTDTETIIHLYEEYGLDFVEKIEGDFAIALWDSREPRLVLARDRIGVKPLYYTVAGGRLIFASEIKAILAHPSVSPDIDEEALYHYLTFLTAPAPRTLFAGINKLPAGCMLTCDGRGDIAITRYWDAVVVDKGSSDVARASEEEIACELRRLLDESIAKRMMSDVGFGIFLSGGLDSTANVALMARSMDRPVRTFTVGFRDAEDYNELEEARLVARHYNTDHHEVVIGYEEFKEFLPRLVFHQDEPIADPVCVPLYYVSELARETGTPVVQVGEGSDELFCGYRDYGYYLRLYDYGWRYLSRLPVWARRAVASSGRALYLAGEGALSPMLRRALPDLFRRLRAGEELFWSGAFVFDETQKQPLLSRSYRERLRAAAETGANRVTSHAIVKTDLDRLLADKPAADYLERMIYQELKLRLPELLLMRVDKITMATSVEARVPFLDHHLVEFAMKLPRQMKHGRGGTKYILKRALSGVVPQAVLERKKRGFGAPIKDWLFHRMGSFVEEGISGSALRRRDLFDYDHVRRLLAEQRAGRINYSFHLWSLLNLSLWYDRWIEQSAVAIENGREISAMQS
ncbi:MAG TPA: asparagine synthase (glutamine-hydrolyzing) [Blastocatellia bacterium]|nr:asparagine synthase (glutamine-hydrolyzing) [Blastocatellia bacterium]